MAKALKKARNVELSWNGAVMVWPDSHLLDIQIQFSWVYKQWWLC
jgi:hypothetical protein